MKHFFLLCVSMVQLCFAAESSLLGIGTIAPPFVLSNGQGTREYLSTWCGERLAKPYVNKTARRVIVSFWSTTCLPCMKEIPELHQFSADHAGDSIKIFLVNLDNMTSVEVTDFAAAKKWTLPVLLDPYQTVAKRYNVTSLPTIYVISPVGKIEHAITGIPPTTTTNHHLEQLIYGSNQARSEVK